MRQLAAQMQMVIGAINTFAIAVLNRLNHLVEVFNAMPAIAHVADANCIQHRGDAAGDHQRIVAAHRRVRRPIHFWAWREELVEIIGVQLHQTRQQEGVFAIQRARQLADAVAKAGDAPVANLQ